MCDTAVINISGSDLADLALSGIWDVFGNGCIWCESIFFEASESVALCASINNARSTRTREIFAGMELPIALKCVFDCGMMAAEFPGNSAMRPAELNELEYSPSFSGCEWPVWPCRHGRNNEKRSRKRHVNSNSGST